MLAAVKILLARFAVLQIICLNNFLFCMTDPLRQETQRLSQENKVYFWNWHAIANNKVCGRSHMFVHVCLCLVFLADVCFLADVFFLSGCILFWADVFFLCSDVFFVCGCIFLCADVFFVFGYIFFLLRTCIFQNKQPGSSFMSLIIHVLFGLEF